MRTGVIYKLTVGNSFIIGSTISRKRKNTHFLTLRNGTHHNSYLQNCYNKYGEDGLKFEILQKDIPEEILLFVEDIWIGGKCGKIGDKKGGANVKDATRHSISEETKIKIGNANRHPTGIKPSKETLQKRAQGYSKFWNSLTNEEKIERLRPLREGWDKNRENFANFHSHRKGVPLKEEHRKKLKDSWKDRKVNEKCILALKKYSESTKGKPKYHLRKKIYQIDIVTNEIIKLWENVSEILKVFSSFSKVSIRKCAKGKQNIYKGFKWSYEKPE